MSPSAVLGAGGFIIYIALVPLILRILRRSSPAVSVLACAITIYVALIALAIVQAWLLYFWAFSATYWFLALCFVMVFGAVYKSISLRILLDLLNREGHADSYEGVLQRYILHESFRDRLQLMVKQRFAVRGSLGISLAPKGRCIAVLVAALQRIFQIERSG
jgi:hypothetical protein